MSIGEVISLYREGDLDVHPEFQRIFRWTEDQKARLVESILLGIPVPAIFVSQREDGVWDVIDGVQRLSTILQFAQVYVDDHNEAVHAQPLRRTEYLPSLEGYVWDGEGLAFSDSQRRDFKRAKLDFRIVKKESDRDAKFDLFQRLNSGTELSAQEARNCLLVMLNAEMFRWLLELGQNVDFTTTVPLSDRKEDEGFRQELILRFLLNREYVGGTGELGEEFGEYLTSWMRSIAVDESGDQLARATTFAESFRLLREALGDDAFRRYDADSSRFLGAFSISAYEAITSGLAAHHAAWSEREPSELRERVMTMWSDPGFRDQSGSGISPRRRMPRLVAFGRTYFE